MSVKCRIIGCYDWKARKPKSPPVVIGPSERIIFHHTAGHHPELDADARQSRQESIAYAHAIQRFHMDVNGWNDSGHNFLVCRNGLILQGRWLTVSAIRAGQMVTSAHCPGQNDQIGIEHEHQGTEAMTRKQEESSSRLMAWIASEYGRRTVLPVRPHSDFFPTACPANLETAIPGIVAEAQRILRAER